MIPRRCYQARSGQASTGIHLGHCQTDSTLHSHWEGPGTTQIWSTEKTNPREDRLIERQALQTRTASSSIIRRHVRVAANINISQQTIRNRLHGFNLRSRRPAVRPRLTPAHRAARRAFCRRHVRWTRHQWSQVLFSDESRFTMNHNDGRLRFWRRPGQRFIDATVQEKVAFGGGSVMVWGAFSLHHRTPLYHVQDNLNGLR